MWWRVSWSHLRRRCHFCGLELSGNQRARRAYDIIVYFNVSIHCQINNNNNNNNRRAYTPLLCPSPPSQVFEQLGPDEVRRFKPDTTVEEAGLCHGSILLFRGVHAQAPPCRPPAAIPPPSASAVACLNPMAAAAAAAAAVAASTAGAAHAAGAAVRPLIAMPSPVTAAAAIRAATGAAGIAPSPSPPHGGAEAPVRTIRSSLLWMFLSGGGWGRRGLEV